MLIYSILLIFKKHKVISFILSYYPQFIFSIIIFESRTFHFHTVMFTVDCFDTVCFVVTCSHVNCGCIFLILFKTPLSENPTQIWHTKNRKKWQKKAPEILMGHNGYHQFSYQFWISHLVSD